MSQSIVPKCEGYILIPSCFLQHGYGKVKFYYSSILTGIIINDKDFIGDNRKEHNDFLFSLCRNSIQLKITMFILMNSP